MKQNIRNLIKSIQLPASRKSFVPPKSIPPAPKHVDFFSDGSPDVHSVHHGMMFMITVHKKDSPLYGKTLLVEKMKNGLYKLVNDNGEKRTDGPKEITIDVEKSLASNMRKRKLNEQQKH